MSKDTGLVSGFEGPRVDMTPEFSKKRHQEAIKRGRDVPELSPEFEIPLSEVGISQKIVWIRLPQGRIPFEAEITTSLPGTFKGIHMSRIENEISILYERDFSDPRDYAITLSRSVLEGQRGNLTKVMLRGTLPIVSKTPISERDSIDNFDYYCKVESRRKNDGEISTSSWLGICISHMTACPCTQEYNQMLFGESPAFPLPTHSQRCKTLVIVQDKENRLSLKEIFELVCPKLHVNLDLLKRPDEAELVYKTHKEPQFAEDVVRAVAVSLAKGLKDKVSLDSRLLVETTSLESIHIHNVKCRLECSFNDLLVSF